MELCLTDWSNGSPFLTKPLSLPISLIYLPVGALFPDDRQARNATFYGLSLHTWGFYCVTCIQPIFFRSEALI